MPRMNHTGPEGKGPKTGRKLGKCHKTESDLNNIGELGKGLGKHLNSEMNDCAGKGLRKKYYKRKTKPKAEIK